MQQSRPPMLAVLVGLPAVGKTTFCKSIAELMQARDSLSSQIKDSTYCVKHIELDALSEAATSADFKPEIWNDARSRMLLLIKEELTVQSESAKLILADDTSQLRSMRRDLYKLARDANAAYVQLFFDVSKDTALQNNSERERSKALPDNAIMKIAESLEDPRTTGTIWDRATLTIAQTHTVEEVWAAVEARWNRWRFQQAPGSGLPQQVVHSSSEQHSLDVQCRKIITKIMRKAEGPRAGLAKELNSLRRSFLQRGVRMAGGVVDVETALRDFNLAAHQLSSSSFERASHPLDSTLSG